MRRLRVWLVAVVATIALLVIVAAVALPYLVDTPRVQTFIAHGASQALGRPVRFKALSATIFPLPAVELRGLEVAEDPRFGAGPFLSLDRGELRLRLGPLFTGRLEFGDLVLRKPLVTVVQDAGGRWNFASLGPAPHEPARPAPARPRGGGGTASAGGFIASRVKLEDGVVTYMSQRGGALAGYRLEDVDVTIVPGAASVRVEGRAVLRPGDVTINLDEVTVAPASGRSLTEAALRGRVRLDAQDVRELVARVAGPTPAVASALKGRLTLGGAVGQPRAAGEVELPGLRVTRTSPECPEPKQRTLALDGTKLNVAWEGAQLTARPLGATIAGGTVTANLSAALEGGVHVEFRDLRIKALPLEKVLVEYLCQPYAITGPLDMSGIVRFAARDPWNTLAGSGQFRVGGGKVVGAKVKALVADVSRAGAALSSVRGPDAGAADVAGLLEFDAITGTFRAASGTVSTSDLLYAGRAANVKIAGQYALGTGRVNLDVALERGRQELQAKVTGTTASPSIRLVPSSVLRSVDPGAVESGLRDLLKRFR